MSPGTIKVGLNPATRMATVLRQDPHSHRIPSSVDNRHRQQIITLNWTKLDSLLISDELYSVLFPKWPLTTPQRLERVKPGPQGRYWSLVPTDAWGAQCRAVVSIKLLVAEMDGTGSRQHNCGKDEWAHSISFPPHEIWNGADGAEVEKRTLNWHLYEFKPPTELSADPCLILFSY